MKSLMKAPRPVQPGDLVPNVSQEGVDLRIGLDIARLALREMVQAIVVVTGDSDQQAKLRGQARETPRQFVERESHYLWGRRYLLTVTEEEAKPSIRLGHRSITLTVRPGSSSATRAAVMHEWHKALLHEAVREMIPVACG